MKNLIIISALLLGSLSAFANRLEFFCDECISISDSEMCTEGTIQSKCYMTYPLIALKGKDIKKLMEACNAENTEVSYDKVFIITCNDQ